MPPLTFAQTSQAFGAKPTTPSQVAQQAAQSMQQAGITSLSGAGGSSGQTLQDKQKDFQLQQALQNAGITNNQDNNQDNNQEDSQVTETKKKKNFDIISGVADFYNAYKNFGGFLGLGAIPFKMIAEPTVETFQNPQALAVLKKLFDEKGKDFKNEYLQNYGELIDEAFKDFDSGITKGLDSNEILDLQLNQASDLSQQGILGEGSQRINFPEEFYAGKNMPATTGNLVNLANLDAQQYLSGENYNPELAQMIFNARAELDRMGKDRSGNTQSGIMAASPALPGLPVPRPGPIPPGTTPPAQPPIPAPVPNILTQPFDINKFYASLPQYSQQGIMSPNLSQFYQNLGAFPRV